MIRWGWAEWTCPRPDSAADRLRPPRGDREALCRRAGPRWGALAEPDFAVGLCRRGRRRDSAADCTRTGVDALLEVGGQAVGGIAACRGCPFGPSCGTCNELAAARRPSRFRSAVRAASAAPGTRQASGCVAFGGVACRNGTRGKSRAASAPAASPTPSPAPAPAEPAGKKWQVQVDAPATPVEWPDKLPVNVPVPYGSDTVLYPATPSPFVVLGLNISGGKDVQLWNLLTQKKIAQLQDAVQSGNPVELSADGRYLAVKSRDSSRRTTVELWSFQTGKVEREIECDDPKLILGLFEFLGSDRLVSYTSGFWNKGVRHSLRFWDVASGNRLHDVEISDSVLEGKTAVSPGGRYYVTMTGSDKLTFYDSSNGEVAAAVDVKDLLYASAGGFQGMSFSPDGRELALVFVETNSKLLLLDVASGKLTDTVELAGKSPLAAAYRGTTVEWLGERGWCLFGGTLVDRATRRVVWHLSLSILDRLNARRTLDQGWIVSTTGAQNRRTLRFIPIPWQKIDASLAAMKEDAAAHLKPDMPVSLNIRVEKLRFGDPTETSSKLADIFRQRFESDGISVADDQPIVLNVVYGESEGETLYERKGIVGPATGRTVQATNVNVKMELKKAHGRPRAVAGRVLVQSQGRHDFRSASHRRDRPRRDPAEPPVPPVGNPDSVFRSLQQIAQPPARSDAICRQVTQGQRTNQTTNGWRDENSPSSSCLTWLAFRGHAQPPKLVGKLVSTLLLAIRAFFFELGLLLLPIGPLSFEFRAFFLLIGPSSFEFRAFFLLIGPPSFVLCAFFLFLGAFPFQIRAFRSGQDQLACCVHPP